MTQRGSPGFGTYYIMIPPLLKDYFGLRKCPIKDKQIKKKSE